MSRPALLVVIFLVFPAFSLADDKEEKAKEAAAKLHAANLLKVCDAYKINPANADAQYPQILLDLVKPPFGGPSYLLDGEKALIDPWGKKFRYAVITDDAGAERAYIWTERTVDGKTKVIGTKPPEPKK